METPMDRTWRSMERVTTSGLEIQIEWQGDRVRLDLSGDFNETSAKTLIESLRKECHEASVVFIQARGVKHLRPAGCETFRRNLHVLKDFCYRLVFADANAVRMAPEWTQCF
jgi:hypothetical protein